MRFFFFIATIITTGLILCQEKPRSKVINISAKHFEPYDTCRSFDNFTLDKQVYVFYDCDKNLFYATDSTLRKTLWKKNKKKLEDARVGIFERTWTEGYDFYIFFYNKVGYLLNAKKGKFKKIKGKKKKKATDDK